MLRWHHPRCRSPNVTVVDNVLWCTNCTEMHDSEPETSSPVDFTLNTVQSSSLELKWPASVSYSSKSDFNRLEQKQTVREMKQGEIAHRLAKRARINGTPLLQETNCYSSLGQKYDFRLLNLTPSSSDSHLHGCLEAVDLTYASKYEALSYTWADEDGDVTRRKTLFLGPYWDCLPITYNCHLALRRLRAMGLKTVWVDAVCINQSNVAERSHQVGIMRDIFAKAERVVIFLGQHNEELVEAMQALVQAPGPPVENSAHDVDDLAVATRERIGKSVVKLFKLRYFTRVWVIQEIAMAKRISMVCGDTYVESTCLDLHAVPIQTIANRYYRKLPEWFIRFGNKEAPELQSADALLDLLRLTSKSSASDPRDNVFAVLGLVSGAQLDGLIPDYTLSLEQIHTGIAAYMLLKRRQACILAYPRPKTSTLASWVPDWTAARHSADVEDQIGMGSFTVSMFYKRDVNDQGEVTIRISGTKTMALAFDLSPDSLTPYITLVPFFCNIPTPREQLFGSPRVCSSDGALSITAWRITTMHSFTHTDLSLYISRPSPCIDFQWVVRTESPVDFDHDELFFIPGCETYLHTRRICSGEVRYHLIGSCEIGFRSKHMFTAMGCDLDSTQQQPYFGLEKLARCLEATAIEHKMMGAFQGVGNLLIEEMEKHLLENDFSQLVRAQLLRHEPKSKEIPQTTKELDHLELEELYHGTASFWDTSDGWKLSSGEGFVHHNVQHRLERLGVWFDLETWDTVDDVHHCFTELRTLQQTWTKWLQLRTLLTQELEVLSGIGLDTEDGALSKMDWCHKTDQLAISRTRQDWRRETRAVLRQLWIISKIQWPEELSFERDISITRSPDIENIVNQWLQEDISAGQPQLTDGEIRDVYDSCESFLRTMSFRISTFERMESSWKIFAEKGERLRHVCQYMSIIGSFQEGIAPLGDVVIM
ncbi:heterokaryon incompatibility protein-domain-containing protein [Xylaria arbuscula]|nr:heterokaryon incompatibility protein-domain-containing protein [Xylaria arbuscula]